MRLSALGAASLPHSASQVASHEGDGVHEALPLSMENTHIQALTSHAGPDVAALLDDVSVDELFKPR